MKATYNLGADNVLVKSTTSVRFNEYFTLATQDDGTIDLMVEITADLVDIPEKYHEVMLNMLSSKYINKVSFGHNPFSKCNPPNYKPRWWQIWKIKSIFI
jgi:hypothetical protein